MARRLDWAEYRYREYAEITDRTIAVLPTAAIEQHGPHLPVGVDAMIMEGMLETLRARLRKADDAPDIRILPVQSVGKSNEHLWAAGTLTLSAETALRAWGEIGASVARAGVRRIVLVNSHGGNLDLVSILARELRVRHGMLAVKTQWMAHGTPDDVPGGAVSEDERRFGIHGGDVETSLMLHFRPDLVDMEAAPNARSSAQDGGLQPTGLPSYGWIATDLSDHGTVGDATRATAERGAAIAAHQCEGFIELLRDVEAFDLSRLK